MRKKELINQQHKAIENMMDIFKILVEGGDVSLHIYKNNKEPAYFAHAKDGKSTAIFSKRIYEGLFSRGLLVLSGDVVCEDFVAQHYVLRTPKETKNKEK